MLPKMEVALPKMEAMSWCATALEMTPFSTDCASRGTYRGGEREREGGRERERERERESRGV